MITDVIRSRVTELAPEVHREAGRPAVGEDGELVDLPEYSQMVYPDGGNVWCSRSVTCSFTFFGKPP